MKDSMHILVLQSDLSELNKLEAFVERISDSHNIGHTYFSNIIVSLTELVKNAIIHGNKNDQTKIVEITFSQQNGKLVFTVKDQGNGFAFPMPDRKDMLLNTNIKNGLNIVNALSDGLEFLENGSQIVVSFDIASANELLSKARMNVFAQYQKSLKNKQKFHE